MTAALTLGLLLVLIAFAVVLWRYHTYKARYQFSPDDLRRARQDSIARSRSVVSGKVQEHLAPLFPEFLSQFNPKDARFVGTPLDFVVFDGLDDGEVRRIVFVEVKTGRSSLIRRERLCCDAIEAGRVEYQLLRLEDASSGVVIDELEGATGLTVDTGAPDPGLPEPAT